LRWPAEDSERGYLSCPVFVTLSPSGHSLGTGLWLNQSEEFVYDNNDVNLGYLAIGTPNPKLHMVN
jgi:hypothetical protein